MDNNMLKFIEIRNSYARPKIGELSINEKALAEYEKFCLDLIKDNEHQKEIIDKTIEHIKNYLPYLQEPDKEYEDLEGNTYFTYKEWTGEELLQILEDKEV